jgi:hypothetical protein
MFIATATRTGWNVYRKGNSALIATFDHLATVKQTVEKMGGKLTVVMNGYSVN